MKNRIGENDQNEIRYLNVLSKIASKLKTSFSLENLCSDICEMITSIMSYPEITVVRIQISTISRMSPDFHATSWGLVREFEGADKTAGRFEVYYTSEVALSSGCPFKQEEEILLDNIACLLSGATTKAAFDRLLVDNTERQKELGGIARIISILQEDRPIQLLLFDVCNVLPYSWQYPEHTGARITYGDFVFATENFVETPWMQKQLFSVPEGPSGSIEICYTKELPPNDEGPFLKEERSLIINLAQLLAAAVGSKMYEQLIAQNRERLKELNAINQTTQIISHGKSIAVTLQSICAILPQSLQFPEHAAARISYAGKEYVSKQFEETPWVLREQLITIDNQISTIEVFYLFELPTFHEGPFLKEERDLIRNIARLLAHFLNNYKGRLLLERSGPTLNKIVADRLYKITPPEQPEVNELFSNPCLGTLSSYVVRDVLFIATPYEAFAVQSEGFSFCSKKDPRHPYGIGYVPRITIVNSSEQALEHLSQRVFDLVMILAGLDISQSNSSFEKISESFPTMPIYILVNKTEQIPLLQNAAESPEGCKQIFVWNNDPVLIFALIKMHEDLRNSVYSHSPVILLVEDSHEALSKIITCSYKTIINWKEACTSTQSVFLDDDLEDDHQHTHLLAASNYETAIHILRQYHNRLCCVISDIEFGKNGALNRNAGLDFVRIIKEQDNHIPCLLHSSDLSNEKQATEYGICFLDKHIPDLLEKIAAFIRTHLKRSVFTFRDSSGGIIEQTGDILRLIHLIENAPAHSIIKSLHEGEFTRWFHIRGEQARVAEVIKLQKSEYDETTICHHLITMLKDVLRQRFRGSTVRFEKTRFFDESFVTVLCGGSYGGKGRGVAFLNSLTNEFPSSLKTPGLKICTPSTAIIGTDEFERILKSDSMEKSNIFELDYDAIRKQFLEVQLSDGVREGLRAFVSQFTFPIAVRSSSLFEDSLTQPFAGAFETYIIPNSNNDLEIRLEQIEQAVKLVFASLYRPEAASYFKISGRSVQEERMAVVIQELVGTDFDSYYYPHISGVAGSFNYYPVSHMKSEDGFVVVAFGLGVYVVEGRSGHRFSPAYPDITFGSIKDSLNNSQVRFYAVNLSQSIIDMYKDGEKAGLMLLDIETAEKMTSLAHCASVYDAENDRIVPNLHLQGPRVVDFANILKYNYIPLAESLKKLLRTLSERMGSPVEIEFAVTLPHKRNNLSDPVLYLLQVKPLVGKQLSHKINDAGVDPQSVVLYSETALGNGVLDTISDVLLVDLNSFDKTKTDLIAMEIEYFNRQFLKADEQYVLIGPGRWGTRDKSLGIPVVWGQISKARVIIELGLVNYPLDASLGSHFFHNLTAMNTGYMAINENQHKEVIKWDAFTQATLIEQRHFVKHLRFPSPLHIEIDGSKRKAVIMWRHS